MDTVRFPRRSLAVPLCDRPLTLAGLLPASLRFGGPPARPESGWDPPLLVVGSEPGELGPGRWPPSVQFVCLCATGLACDRSRALRDRFRVSGSVTPCLFGVTIHESAEITARETQKERKKETAFSAALGHSTSR